MRSQLQPALKLTVFVGGDERHSHHPLYQEVLRLLHRQNINGATVTKGVMSFGIRRVIHSSMNEITMENLPIIIEAIDELGKIDQAAKLIAEMLGEDGLIEVQPTMAIHKGIEKSERSNP